MLCPRCEQDQLVAARVRASGQAIVLCPECDALWLSMRAAADPAARTAFLDYGTWMTRQGLPPLWDELSFAP